jgi:hypothetical protein
MFTTDKKILKEYTSPYRYWQGIPGIEVTKKGRIFACFYSGGVKEETGNYCMLTYSDDGTRFSEPIALAVPEKGRCYDPVVWIDPLGRLWFIWAYMSTEKDGVYAVICDDPDEPELRWSEPRRIGFDVMMNKPTILSTGEWMFPIAVWDRKKVMPPAFREEYYTNEGDKEVGAFLYKTTDGGETFVKYGKVDMPDRSFDEHMILELSDGRLATYVRTFYGIGVAYSSDRGKTWTQGEDSGLGGPCSRFFIRRLRSGRLLLVNHCDFTGRDHLTALLSEDDGKTWKYKLMLDERANVSYPDAVEDENGNIYVTYDRERGAFLKTVDEIYASAREILYARITEEDIIAGELVCPESKLKQVISKLVAPTLTPSK